MRRYAGSSASSPAPSRTSSRPSSRSSLRMWSVTWPIPSGSSVRRCRSTANRSATSSVQPRCTGVKMVSGRSRTDTPTRLPTRRIKSARRLGRPHVPSSCEGDFPDEERELDAGAGEASRVGSEVEARAATARLAGEPCCIASGHQPVAPDLSDTLRSQRFPSTATIPSGRSRNRSPGAKKWRRGESNPRPRPHRAERLRA
jgi:hypothetical protein